MAPALAALPALLFSVIAVTLQFISIRSDLACALRISTSDDCERLSQHYFDSGERTIEALKQRKPTTTSIEYYLSKCTWLKNCGNAGKAWQSLGTAIRQAQEIDLHQIHEDEIQAQGLDVEQSLSRFWELEHRKRLWARLFILDAHMAMALDRPRTIHREDCSTPPPLDCDYPSWPTKTVPQSTNHAHQPPNTFSHTVFWIGLSHRIHDMLSLRASKAHLRGDAKIQSIHQEIISLMDELPLALRPSYPDTTRDLQMPQLPALRQRILTAASIFLLALHRPYTSTHPVSQRAAVEAASEILRAQQRLFEIVSEPQRKLYAYSFYTLDAGTFITKFVLKYPTSDLLAPTSTLQELRLAAARLSLMKDRNPVAEKGEPILQRCCLLLEARIYAPPTSSGTQDFGDGSLLHSLGNPMEYLNSSALDESSKDPFSTMSDFEVPFSTDIDLFEQPRESLGQTGHNVVPYLDDDTVDALCTNMHSGRGV